MNQQIEALRGCGWPRARRYDTLWRRVCEAWWILTDRQSLHRAWQCGFDEGHRDEYRRIVINGGDLHPIMLRAVSVAYKHALQDDLHPDVANHLIAAAWKEHRAPLTNGDGT